MSESKSKYDKVLNSIRQNRYKLEQYLITLQSQQQMLAESIQKIMEEELNLQGKITGNLSQFEEKAGASQGLQGLFHGNPLLKNEIMQKRVALEQNIQKMREMSYQLQQKVQQMSKTVQDIGRYVTPEMVQEENYLEEIIENQQNKEKKVIMLEDR
jgi:chromosome segregation ATPase